MLSFPLSSRIYWTGSVCTYRLGASYFKYNCLPSVPWIAKGNHCSKYLSTCQNLKTKNEITNTKDTKRLNVVKRSKEDVECISSENETIKMSTYASELSDWTPIYRCNQIVAARTFQRFKIAQTVFTVLIAGPLTVAGFVYQIVDVSSVYFALGGSVLASTMLYIVGNFFTRLIGNVYISKKENPLKTVRIARLDFWGGRVDELISIKNIVPLSEHVEHYHAAYVKVRQYTDEDDSEAYNISFKYGDIIDEEKFERIFGGLPP